MKKIFFTLLFLIPVLSFAQISSKDSTLIFCGYLSKIEKEHLIDYHIKHRTYFSIQNDLNGLLYSYSEIEAYKINKLTALRMGEGSKNLEILYEKEIELSDLNNYILTDIEKDFYIIEQEMQKHTAYIQEKRFYDKTGRLDTSKIQKELSISISLYNYNNDKPIIYNNEFGEIKYSAYIEKVGMKEYFFYQKDTLNLNQNNVQFPFLVAYNILKKFGKNLNGDIKINIIDNEFYKERKKKIPKIKINCTIKYLDLYKIDLEYLKKKYEELEKIRWLKNKECGKLRN